MVNNQLPPSALAELSQLLEHMNSAAIELEEIGKQEQEAIHRLDSDLVIQLSDRRVLAHQQLSHLESQCHELLRHHNVPQDMTLEMVIDMYAGSQSSEFQAIRRKLYDRIMSVDKSSQRNRMQLLATYNVTSTILQQLGLTQPGETYSRSTIK